MVCSPDSQMIMWKPTACQIDSTMIAGSAVLGLFSQSAPCSAPNVTVSMNELISPVGWYMNFQRIDTTTIDVTTGMKKTIRKNVTPRSFWLTSTASSSPSPACTGTTTIANRNVLRTDRRNDGVLRERPDEVVEPDEPRAGWAR